MPHVMQRGFLTCLLLLWSMQFAIGQQLGKTYRIAIVFPTIPIAEIAESISNPFIRPFFKETASPRIHRGAKLGGEQIHCRRR